MSTEKSGRGIEKALTVARAAKRQPAGEAKRKVIGPRLGDRPASHPAKKAIIEALTAEVTPSERKRLFRQAIDRGPVRDISHLGT